jgi:hypothetical protein
LTPQKHFQTDQVEAVLSRLLVCSLLLLATFFGNGQGILEYHFDGSEHGKSLETVLEEIEASENAHFYFLSDWIGSFSFEQSFKGKTLEDALGFFFRGTDLNYINLYSHALIIVKDPEQALLRKIALESAQKPDQIVDQYKFGEMGKANDTKKVIVSGHVLDAKTDETMPFASIQVADMHYATTTDQTGNFTLSLTPGFHILNFSFLDYEVKVIDLEIYENGIFNVILDKKSLLLDEIIIQYNYDKDISTSRIGQTQLVIPDMKRAPSFLGETDLIKQIQYLPGVTTVGEAASGFNVRGGSVDQNLILYDGIPVYNSSHVFGFFSAFNAEAVRDVSFFGGGIPAEYGGRISSVLDIKSRDGDYEKWHGKAGIGMVTGNLMLNGPIKKEKTAVNASFRSTYSDWLIHSIRSNYADLSKSSVSFYDGTVKVSHLFSGNTKLALTTYSSKDGFRLAGDSTYKWTNFQISAKLDHQFSNKLGSELILGMSAYGYDVINGDSLTASNLSYRIITSVAKAGFNYQEGNHKFNFGIQLSHYQLDPGTLKPTSVASNVRKVVIDKQFSLENALYFSDTWSFSEQLFIEGGLRLPMFVSYGPASINRYEKGKPLEVFNIVDTVHYQSSETIKVYFGIEPRLSIRYMIDPYTSIKMGYNRMYQYLHLVTNTTAVTPVDIWQPSGYYFKPQRADQVSVGYFKESKEKKYGTSGEVFYKTMNDIIDFKDGAELVLNDHLETELLQGKGHAYGLETSFYKNKGKLTGTLNYTYSRSFRQISGATSDESINSGKRYRANFDQPHVLNLSWKYQMSRRYFFTGNFTYHTGRPVTIPLSAFQLENSTIAYYSGRNQYRIPDYHRMDLALVVEGTNKKDKKIEGTWVFSIYNVYSRRNPYSVFFKNSGAGIPIPYQLSIIGTLFPSVSYNIEF